MGGLVVAGGDPALVLEVAEHALDSVTVSTGGPGSERGARRSAALPPAPQS